MTATLSRSAYPKSVDELVPQVSEWAAELGRVPSRNQIMSTFRVGAPKANEILDRLTEPGVTDDAQHRDLPDADTAAAEANTEVTPVADPGVPVEPQREETPALAKRIHPWPVFLLALPAFVAIWGGWVGIGEMTGFGPIHLFPGFADDLVLNSAITLPIGVETYAAFALRVWLSASSSARTRDFAKWSAIGALGLGMAGQIAYHLMEAAGVVVAPWIVTTAVSCLPVGVLGCGSALAHLLITDYRADKEGQR